MTISATEADVAVPAPDWLGWTTGFVVFTGKGGVGKTTMAAAAAVHPADHGH